MTTTTVTSALDVLLLGPVVPVVVLDDDADAVPLARALLAGGVRVMEVTLRTPAALEAVRRVAAEVPDVVVGAGTVLTPADAARAAAAGARFLVTPGTPPGLLDAVDDTGVPALPGAATVTELMTLADRGRTTLKFFPAEPAGGAAYLAAVAGPLPALRFCPTGGITAANAADYLALPSVPCVGGSWLAPRDAVRAGDWSRVTDLAYRAAALRG